MTRQIRSSQTKHSSTKLIIALALVAFSQEPIGERIYPVVYAQNAQNCYVPIETIFLEARGEGLIGMTAVAEVIRTRAKNIGDTPTDVCMKKYQFSVWNPGKQEKQSKKRLSRMTEADWQLAAKAWAESEYSNLTNGAEYYYADLIKKPIWAYKMQQTAKIGHHIFLKDNKRKAMKNIILGKKEIK